MASESKVIGNVKLRLRAVNGKSYMISRSLEVTQKVKTISKKQLDGTVKDIQTGAALTSKCADLDAKVKLMDESLLHRRCNKALTR